VGQLSGGERRERAHEKHAWILVFAMGLFLLVFGFGKSVVIALDDRAIDDDVVRAVSGTSWGELKATSPGATRLVLEYLIAAGLVTLLLGLAVIAICLRSYRRGERWAWYALWVLPLNFVIGLQGLVLSLRVGAPPLFVPLLFVIISLLGLLLPYRKFFPKKAVSG